MDEAGQDGRVRVGMDARELKEISPTEPDE